MGCCGQSTLSEEATVIKFTITTVNAAINGKQEPCVNIISRSYQNHVIKKTSLREGTDVMRGWVGGWGESCHQCNGVGSLTQQDAPSATFGDHQQSWWAQKNQKHKKLICSLLISVFRTCHWFYSFISSDARWPFSTFLSRFWQSFTHSKSFIMTFKDEIFILHAMVGVSFKYSNLRQVSPKFHICLSSSSGDCDTKSGWNIQVSATCHTNFHPQTPKLLSQILRPGFKYRSNFRASRCKTQLNCKMQSEYVKLERSGRKVFCGGWNSERGQSWNSWVSVWQLKPHPISVRFYDICEHLWNICELKSDFGD